MRFKVHFFILLIYFFSGSAQGGNFLTQYGITWTFDRELSETAEIGKYQWGQFANGDYWVVNPDADDANVKIVGIDPPSTTVDGRTRNGSMLNPNQVSGQSYDSGAASWTGEYNVAIGVSLASPLVIDPTNSAQSLISSIGRGEAPLTPQIQTAAVLTILAEAPPAGSFRPPYFGSNKSVQFNVSDLNLSLLRNLTPVSGAPSLETVRNWFQRPWIDHLSDWMNRLIHPLENMPNYGRELAARVGEGALALNLRYDPDDATSNAKKQDAVINFVQLGIDNYGLIAAGQYKVWLCSGGHSTGRKFPILFAGCLLNDENMKSVGQRSGMYGYAYVDADGYNDPYGPYPSANAGTEPPGYIWFGEDDQTFYVSQRIVDITVDPRDWRDGTILQYEQEDIGMPEWGIIHFRDITRKNKWWPTIYRNVVGCSFSGFVLAAHIMEEKAGMRTLWNHPPLFDYTDRYVQMMGGKAGTNLAHHNTFIKNMWDRYRTQCGPVWPETGGDSGPRLLSIGDKHVLVTETLTFTISATGSNLTYSADGLPNGATFSDQIFTWTPTANQLGTHQVMFTVSDGQAQDSETVTITVSLPNAAPILGSIGDKATSEDHVLTFSIGATDADGDSLTYSASGLPSGASFIGQTFNWTPGYDQAGTYSVTFSASDGRAQDSQAITISVANVNRPPALAAIGDRSVDENNTLALALSATDPDGTGLTYSAAGLPAGANLADGNFTWTPTADQVGSHEITFTVSDGTLTDSETMTIVVVSAGADYAGPVVARQSPAPGAIQVPLNNLITLHVTDAGQGVNPASVTITVDGRTVYQGDSPVYTSPFGTCTRSGVENDYEFVYQDDRMFDFDHEVVVTVGAADLAGNVMPPSTYSFGTEMRVFGSNTRASQADTDSKGAPATVGDAAGNLWAAWHAGPVGARDIYVARLPAGQTTFENPIQITRDSADQCNPDLALAANGALYVVWQDNRQGQWDIFGAVNDNGQVFSKETVVTDANDNQTAPSVAVDSESSNRIWVAWQDDRNGNQDIYVASSTNAFASVTASRVTTDTADQTEPDLAVGGANLVYLAWTDARSGQADIYGATPSNSWANVPLVLGPGNQTNPALAADGSALHLLWVDDVSGDSDIYYASSNGLSTGPLTGINIIDDTSGGAQTAPALACTNDGKVFACWQDARNIGVYGNDTDIYFTELTSGGAQTNVLVNDGGANANQSEPALAVSTNGQPYIIWTDDRDTTTEIYCAATTYVDPTPLYATVIAADSGATVGTALSAISHPDDVSIVVPAGACRSDVRVTISKILNPLISPDDCLGSYDFGPSGIEFGQPVTVTIPYRVSGNRQARAYWYNSLTGALSQQGMTDIENITINGALYALRFKTTHFTPYYVVADGADVITYSRSGSVGGCSMSATGDGSPAQLLVPYAIVAVAMAILRRRDKKRAMRDVGP